MTPRKVLAGMLLLMALGYPAPSSAFQPGSQSQEQPIAFSLSDIDGRLHTPREFSGARAAVFLFIAAECPISNRYSPEINAIVAEYSQKNIAFYGVHSEPDLPREMARRHSTEYGYQFPILLDAKQVLAGRFGARMTPTAIVVAPAGEVFYRGRIDNRYLDFGRFRNAGITPDLRIALESVVNGRRVEVPVTKTVGCAIPDPSR